MVVVVSTALVSALEVSSWKFELITSLMGANMSFHLDGHWSRVDSLSLCLTQSRYQVPLNGCPKSANKLLLIETS